VKQSTFIFGILVLAAATVLGGAIQGHMSRRWGAPSDLPRLAGQLEQLPQEIGPWKMKAAQELASSAKAVLECAGYVGRQYENRETGDVVTMFVLLGPAGPVSVHTPDVCYSSQEYVVRQPPGRVTLNPGDGAENLLWSTTLQSTRMEAGYLRVYYGWSTGGSWSAPGDARFAFAGQPYLYKLQVAGPLLTPTDEKGADPCWNFLHALLPEISRYLVKPVKE
jgi:hypothetical protein